MSSDPIAASTGVAMRVTRVGQALLRLGLALLPGIAIAYLQVFQVPPLVFRQHGVHELSIALSTVLGGFVTWVTWVCHRSSGEVFLRWLVLGLLGFTLLYAPHGLFTRLSDAHMALFAIYGPLSRLAMAICFLLAVRRFGMPAEAAHARGRSGFWRAGVGLMVSAGILAGLATVAWPHAMERVRIVLEGLALATWLLGLPQLLLQRRSRSPLVLAYLYAAALFAQSSVGFLVAATWTHQWWLAHAIFAAGFFVLSYGVLQAFRTTRSFADAYSQEDIVERLRLEKLRADHAVVELEQANRRLRTLATTDALTGAANRRQYAERAGIEVERVLRHGVPLSLLALDLDHFKAVNDRHGHLVGDEVLKAFVATVKSTLRIGDLLARTGGEEFRILLPDTTLPEAVRIAERVRQRVGGLRVAGPEGELAVTVSVGCAACEGNLGEAERLADARLYRAKAAGRDRVVHEGDAPAPPPAD